MFADLLNQRAEAAMGLEQFPRGSLGAGEVVVGVEGSGRIELEGDEATVHLGCGESMSAGLEEGREFEFGGFVG